MKIFNLCLLPSQYWRCVIEPFPLGSSIPNTDCRLVSSINDGGLRLANLAFFSLSR